MKILYLVYFDLFDTSSIGIRKKVLWQFKAMEKQGFEIELAYRKEDKLIFINTAEAVLKEYNISGLWYRSSIYKSLKILLSHNVYDVVYIRTPGFVDPAFYKTLNLFKRKGIDVYLEMPTYPIGKEYIMYCKQLFKNRKIKRLIFQIIGGLIHKLLSRKIKKFVSYIVTFMSYKKIWGIDVIEIENGVTIEDIPIVTKSIERTTDADNLVLLGVANVDVWHGYDRVLHGLANYYQSDQRSNMRNIKFYIVGEGREIENLKLLSSKLSLEGNVCFCGMRSGKELDNLFDKADLGISSLGMHRIGVLQGSTLKTKEYCARGIPFVYAYNEKQIPEDFTYALKIPHNEEALNMNTVMNFLERIAELPIEETLRKFAEDNFTWEKQMSIVASKIRERKLDESFNGEL